MTSAILLCAGKSTRFGSPKGLFKIGHKTLLDRSLEVLQGAHVDELIIVTGAYRQAIESSIESSAHTKIVWNAEFASGMMSSIQKGVKAISHQSQAIILMLMDLPFIETRHINHLIEAYQRSGKSMARYQWCGRPTHPVILSKVWVPEILAMPAQDMGCRKLFEAHVDEALFLELESERLLTNINTLADGYKSF